MRFLRFCVWLCVCLHIQAGSIADEAPKIERDRISFELADLAGRKVSLSDDRFKDKVVLVDLWGTWCPPCRKAIPFLVDLHERYGSDGLEIVGIAFEEGEDIETRHKTMREFAGANGIDYLILDGEGNSQEQAMKVLPALTEVYGLPTMFVVGRDGTVKYSHSGFVPSDEEVLKDEIESALHTKQPPQGENSRAK